jgi:hypothetical protein
MLKTGVAQKTYFAKTCPSRANKYTLYMYVCVYTYRRLGMHAYLGEGAAEGAVGAVEGAGNLAVVLLNTRMRTTRDRRQ